MRIQPFSALYTLHTGAEQVALKTVIVFDLVESIDGKPVLRFIERYAVGETSVRDNIRQVYLKLDLVPFFINTPVKHAETQFRADIGGIADTALY